MPSRRKYSPRFLAEVVKELPPWCDQDFVCVHREVFEDDTLMEDKIKLIVNNFLLQDHSDVIYKARFYRLSRINKN